MRIRKHSATAEVEVDQTRLYATDDAMVWSQEFAKVEPDVDQGFMIGWFANAIETAKAIERKRIEEADKKRPIGMRGLTALRQIMNELGVPGPGYPANVANAFNIAAEAVVGRCSPEHPCAFGVNQEHLDIWGECYVHSYERIVNFGKSQDAGEGELVTAVKDPREVDAQ